MLNENITDESPHRRGIYSAVKKSVSTYGILRWLLAVPLIIIYNISFALLIPEYKTPFQVNYEDLKKRASAERSGITTPVTLPADLFYYSSRWQDISGENPLANTLMTSSLEYLFKSMCFLKDIQDSDEDTIRKMISDKMTSQKQEVINELTQHDIYGSISRKGEYFTRLFEQLFVRHSLKKLGAKYSEADVDVFFNLLCKSPEEKRFRRILGALILNVPYYLVVKNSINEYYQNSSILIPVDLFSFTLFMMYLDEVKNKETRPTIDECRSWVFSVLVPDDEKLKELNAKPFSFQPVIREEMIMPNPGYNSKSYDEKEHKAIDIASERGTMIRSPLSGTVQYYEKSPKKERTGNFIIIKDEKSEYNIFICHMDEKDFIEEHSTEGELAEPIANLEPDWIHLLKKGQFFEVVGSSGKSTGAHTHIQIAQRKEPYTTFDFLAVNDLYKEKFKLYLEKNGLWQEYSRNEELLLSVMGMVASEYDSTRHFADRDPVMLEKYKELQRNYTPASIMIDPVDISLEEIPEIILHTYFSRAIQEKIINERYNDRLKFYKGLIFQLNHHLKQQVPLAPDLPAKAIPLTPWQTSRCRKSENEGSEPCDDNHERLFYHAVNKFFLYKILQINDTPREIRDHMLSDVMFTGNAYENIPEDIFYFPVKSMEDRINALEKYIQGIMNLPVDLSVIYDDQFCESIFTTIITACNNQGMELDSNFGFFRYDMDELHNLYETSRFINFSDSREFIYDNKYDNALRSFALEIFELAAENRNSHFFRLLFKVHDEKSLSVIGEIIRRSRKSITRKFTRMICKVSGREYPAEATIKPHNLYPVFQTLAESIIKPRSYELRTYNEKTIYRATESALFYSLIYEVYLIQRECCMDLFPGEELSGVLDAIGLFDSMFRVFCENSVRKELIESEHARITQELVYAEKELATFRLSKKQLQEEFRKETISIKELDDYIGRHTELFSKYFKEEEKINEMITGLEQTLDRYRNECILLKNEKEHMLKLHEEKLRILSGEMEALKMRSTLDQERFRLEIRNISYHKEKAEQEISELKKEIDNIKGEIQEQNVKFEENQDLLKKYKKAIANRTARNSEQDRIITELSNEISSVRKINDDIINVISTGTGSNTEEINIWDLTDKLADIVKQAGLYKDQNNTIRLLEERQKNDKRNLMLNHSLITRLKDKTEKLQVQLEYLHNTNSSSREKELEKENGQLSISVRELKEEIRSLINQIKKT